jgi:hypothetical protein
MCRVFHLKRNPKIKLEALPFDVVDTSNTRVSFILAARLLLWSVAQKLCRCERDLLSGQNVLIFKHYFASKSFAAVCEDLEVLQYTA